MVIETSNSVKLDIKEDYLVVKDKKLYNTKTKKYEGLDGDIVSFMNGNMLTKGTVDGYTCGNKVKLRGVDKPFEEVSDVKVEHLLNVVNSDEDELSLAENA